MVVGVDPVLEAALGGQLVEMRAGHGHVDARVAGGILGDLRAGQLDARAIAGGADGDAVQRAAWTLVARAVFNLDEFVTRE